MALNYALYLFLRMLSFSEPALYLVPNTFAYERISYVARNAMDFPSTNVLRY